MCCFELLFAFCLGSTQCVDRRGRRDLIKIRRQISDFPLTPQGAPQSQAGFLLDVIEIKAEVFGTETDDASPQKLPVFLENGVESSLDLWHRRFFNHGCAL